MPRTKEQQEYVEKLLSKKKIPKSHYRRRKVWTAPPETKKTDYMRNCIFWIDEYIEGRTDIERLKVALQSLKVHIADIEKKYHVDSPVSPEKDSSGSG